ncbi:uncharacterized protein LOC125474165 [Pyrus x bretschneideri]|uniref:uncharacterized protein LOC125474165 n=1 Tax=Pyrus x bretschneideri TaxID=225117 RepID=UPI00202E80BF|nr:uncharacterized protein LOC125474165 [Pyrus x bretschneideri]
MALSVSKFSAILCTAILFANLHALCRSSSVVPTISASPSVLPNGNPPSNNMSSFFPSPSDEASNSSDAFAPVPSSGQFVGKVSSANPNSDCQCGALMFGAGLSTLFLFKFANAA